MEELHPVSCPGISMALGWCLHYDLGHCCAGLGPTLSAVMRTCSWQVAVQIPAHASPPPHRQFQDPGRENGLLFPPCGLVPRRILVFLPNAGSRTLCFVLEMLPAGVALRQPGKGSTAWGLWGGGSGLDWWAGSEKGPTHRCPTPQAPSGGRQEGEAAHQTKSTVAVGLWGLFS